MHYAYTDMMSSENQPLNNLSNEKNVSIAHCLSKYTNTHCFGQLFFENSKHATQFTELLATKPVNLGEQ